MTTLALVVVAAVGFIVIAIPVLQYIRHPWRFNAPNGEEEALREEQIIALDALRDLAMDYRMGQLSQEDYRAMAVPLQRRAKHTLERQNSQPDRESELGQLDSQVEAEILAARRTLPFAKGTRFCPQCGEAAGTDFRFCAACGTALPEAKDEPQPASTETNGTEPSPSSTLGAVEDLSTDRASSGNPHIDHASTQVNELKSTVGSSSIDISNQNEAGLTENKPGASRTKRWWVAAGLFAALWIVGVTWLYLSSRSSQEAQIPVLTLPSGPVQFVAATSDRTLVGSNNAQQGSNDGSTWAPLEFPDRFRSIVPLDNEGQAWIASGEQGLWRSANRGETWQRMTTNLADLRPDVLAVTPGTTDGIWGADTGGIYFSHDGGSTWQIVTSTPPGRIRALTVGQNDVYLGTDKGVFLSRDRGSTWIDWNGMVNGRIGSTDIQALALDETGQIIFAATPLGLYFMYLSSPGGWGQRSLRANVTALGINRKIDGELWVGTANGEIYRSANRGVTWQ